MRIQSLEFVDQLLMLPVKILPHSSDLQSEDARLAISISHGEPD